MAEQFKELRSLRCDFTAEELHKIGAQLGSKNKELESIKDEKKSVTSQFKARMDEIAAQINKLSNHVTDGFEMREVEVEVKYNKPEAGRKTIIRLDTDKIAAVEKMTAADHNLFNQVLDEMPGDGIGIEKPKRRRRSSKSDLL